MSFGFGVGDFVTALQLANDAYQACRNGPGEHKEIAREAKSLRYTLDQLSADANDNTSLLNRKGTARHAEYLRMIKNCENTFSDLLNIVKRHSKLESGPENTITRVWHAYQVGSSDLDTIRGQLTFHTSALTLFLTCLEGSSIARMESTLDKIYARLVQKDIIQAGGSTVSVSSTATMRSRLENNDETAWDLLKGELRLENIPIASIMANKEEIIRYMKSLLQGPPLAAENMIQPYKSIPQGEELLAKGVDQVLVEMLLDKQRVPQTRLVLSDITWGSDLTCLIRLQLDVLDHAARPSFSTGHAAVAICKDPSSSEDWNRPPNDGPKILRYAPRLICGPSGTTTREFARNLGPRMSWSQSVSLPMWTIEETLTDLFTDNVTTDAQRRDQRELRWTLSRPGLAAIAQAPVPLQVLIIHKGAPFHLSLSTSAHIKPTWGRLGSVPSRTVTNAYKFEPREPVDDTKLSMQGIDNLLGPEVVHYNSEDYR